VGSAGTEYPAFFDGSKRWAPIATHQFWRKELSDSATLLPVSGQRGLASVLKTPFKCKIHGNLGGML
jgi:hypothetical protein